MKSYLGVGVVLLCCAAIALAQVQFPIGWFRTGSAATQGNSGSRSNSGGLSTPSQPGGLGLKIGEFEDEQLLADREINDFWRFKEADQRGTYEFVGAGMAIVPVRETDYSGKPRLVPIYGTDIPLTTNVWVSLVGLVCIDGEGGCELQVIANAGGVRKFVAQSTECRTNLAGTGQGFIDAKIELIRGCDVDELFPERLIINVVFEEDGEGHFEVEGCHNGLEARVGEPYGHGRAAEQEEAERGGYEPRSDVFQCAPAATMHAGYVHPAKPDESSEGLRPISIFGSFNRQSGDVRRLEKDDKPDMGPLGSSGSGNSDNKNKDNEDDSDRSEDCKRFPCPEMVVEPLCCAKAGKRYDQGIWQHDSSPALSMCSDRACEKKKNKDHDNGDD